MENRSVGTRERYIYSDQELIPYILKSNLNPDLILSKPRIKNNSLIVLSWGKGIMDGFIVEWNGENWIEM